MKSVVLACILAHPQGIARSAIIAATGICKSTVNLHCAALRADGLVVSVGTGPATRWGPPSLAWEPKVVRSPAYLRHRAAHAAARRREAREIRYLEGVDDPLPVTRIIVAAHNAKPLPKIGVASVWELAA